MYCLKLALFGSQTDRLALSDLYGQIAERQFLPGLEQLRQSVDSSIVWPAGDYQAYYLDNLREPQQKLLFQIRTRTRRDSRDYTDLFFSVQETPPHALLNLTIQFPPRGDRGLSSFVIGALKEMRQHQHVELDFLLEGFFERMYHRWYKDNFVRSTKLSEFQWHEELHRYLHVKENLEDVQEIRRGKL